MRSIKIDKLGSVAVNELDSDNIDRNSFNIVELEDLIKLAT
jgi:hypothetical protein